MPTSLAIINFIRKYLLPAIVATFIFSSCKKSTTSQTRSFYMGVTPWPPDFTSQDVDRAYDFINTHCDIVSHHFDDGIPYQQAANDMPMPMKLQNEVNTRKAKTKAGQKIFLSVSALSLTRLDKAVWLTDTTDATVDNYWKSLPFNDSMVIKAYINYMSYLIDAFQPVFVNYGVESNSESWNSVNFSQYKDFLSMVYTRLKTKYPGLPFFISFMVGEDSRSLTNASQLTGYTDYIALSAYPYTNVSSSANGNTDPALFPSNYFTRYIDLDPAKPFGFAETGYIAENLDISSYNLHKIGTAQWQADYLNLICKICNDRNAKFLIWFCSYDYDAADIRLKQLGLYIDLFGFWQDTGLYDQNFNPRLSYTVWNTWMSRERR